ncbi:MarR family transcriptional regulator [Dyella japonica A8]|uniref:MarR family transcriptional regulator n=2 Tax=Dyella japonica TaxID=231455 RepID=A0A075JWY5_9GAMM|nr:MarR family transcriptional regulator [Dyella japonica]AIF46419.1 MarR family transcriptional regulator [Dyella japonica A8]
MSPSNPPSYPQDSIGVLVGLVRSEIVRKMEAELQASGVDLRFTQFLILKRLAHMGPMSASELARAVELDGGAMTRQLDQLERKGLLRRQPHEQDRRALRIELTPAGDAIWRQITPCNDRVLDAAQKALNPTEREQLRDYLVRVLEALRDMN